MEALADARRMRVAFLGLGIMGSRMAANLAARRLRADRLDAHAARRPTRWAAEHGGTAAATPGRGGRGRGRRRSRWSSTAPQVATVLLGDAGRAAARHAAALCVDMSTIAPSAARAIAAELGERGRRLHRRAGHRLLAEGRGRHADDHGRRPAPRTSSAHGRCSRRWASWSLHVGAARSRADDQGHQQRRRGGATRGGRPGAGRWPTRPGSTSTRSSGHAGAGLRRLDDARAQGRPMRDARLRRRSSSSSTCSRTCASASRRPGAGSPFGAAPLRATRSTRAL